MKGVPLPQAIKYNNECSNSRERCPSIRIYGQEGHRRFRESKL
jgi:hypothetical protein